MPRMRPNKGSSEKKKKKKNEYDDESDGEEESPLIAAMMESESDDDNEEDDEEASMYVNYGNPTEICTYIQHVWENFHRLQDSEEDDKEHFLRMATLVDKVYHARKTSDDEGEECYEFPQFKNRDRPLLCGVQMVNACAIEILQLYGPMNELFGKPRVETLLMKWTGFLLTMDREGPIELETEMGVMDALIAREYSTKADKTLDLSVRGLFESHLKLNPKLFPKGWKHFEAVGRKKEKEEKDYSGLRALLFMVYISCLPVEEVHDEGAKTGPVVNRVRDAFAELAKCRDFQLMKDIGYLLFAEAPDDIGDLQFAQKVCNTTGGNKEFFVTQVLCAKKAPKRENNKPNPVVARDLQTLIIIWVATVLLPKMHVMDFYEEQGNFLQKWKRIKGVRKVYDSLKGRKKPIPYYLGYDIALRNFILNNDPNLTSEEEAEKMKKPRGRPSNENTVKGRLDALEKTMTEVTTKVDEGFEWLRNFFNKQNATMENEGNISHRGAPRSRVEDVEEVPVQNVEAVAAQDGTQKPTKKPPPHYEEEGDKKIAAQEKPKSNLHEKGVAQRAGRNLRQGLVPHPEVKSGAQSDVRLQGTTIAQRDTIKSLHGAPSQGKSGAQRDPCVHWKTTARRDPSKPPHGAPSQRKSMAQSDPRKAPPQRQFPRPHSSGAEKSGKGRGQVSLLGIGGKPIPRKGKVNQVPPPEGRKKSVVAESESSEEVQLVRVQRNEPKKRKREEFASEDEDDKVEPESVARRKLDNNAGKRSPMSKEPSKNKLQILQGGAKGKDYKQYIASEDEDDKDEPESIAPNKLDNFQVDLENGEEFEENENEEEDNEKLGIEEGKDGRGGETEEHESDMDHHPQGGQEYGESEEGEKTDP